MSIDIDIRCGSHHSHVYSSAKNTIGDGGSTAVETVDTVNPVDTVDTVDIVDTVDTVDTVYTIETALHCYNISMYACIYC